MADSDVCARIDAAATACKAACDQGTSPGQPGELLVSALVDLMQVFDIRRCSVLMHMSESRSQMLRAADWSEG